MRTMRNREQLREKALKAIEKKALYGVDVDLSQFDKNEGQRAQMSGGDLCALPEIERDLLAMAGIDITEQGRAGTFFQENSRVTHCSAKQEGVEVIPLKQALEHHDWIWDYYWKLVAVDADKYTAAAELDLHDGYVIRALPGSKTIYPIQACMFMNRDNFQQNVHNIIIVEENAELHMITGCVTSSHMKRGIHIGISEFFVKKHAKLSFTMIHNWAEEMYVRPRSAAIVEEGGLFLNNYVCMKPVVSLQMYPTTHLAGPGAVARFYSIISGTPHSTYDLGGRIYLNHPGNRAEIVSRAITNGGTIIALGAFGG